MPNEIDESISDACFDDFLRLTHKLTGITIAESRKSMLISRLRKRLTANSLLRFDDYLEVLRRNPDEIAFFVDNITTNETYFMRTPRIWSYLFDEFVPQWINQTSGRPLRLWSAAASTGEEAHTAGIFLDAVRERQKGFDYRVLGTDISSRVVGVARQGRYSGRSIDRFRAAQPELFKRYLTGTEASGFEATSSIRDRLRFETHNLFTTPPPGTDFDIVLLRNVLIYFTKVDQEKVLQNIQRTMTENSVLIIGESETLSSLVTGFKSIAPFVYRLVGFESKATA